MKQFKLIIGILLIFLTGAAAGHLGTMVYYKNKIYTQGPPPLHRLLRHKITRDLRLTDAQKMEFDRIISQAEKDFDAFRRHHHPEVTRIFDACFDKINAILDPVQQKQLEIIKKRFRQGPGNCSPPHHSKNQPLPPGEGK